MEGGIKISKPTNPRKQEIVDYVAREIAHHKAREIERFTSPEELERMFDISYSAIMNYLRNSSILLKKEVIENFI